MGVLYLVATPIGNLEDITLRAIRILKSAVLVAAEDTRQTQKLFQRYEIAAPLISYHEHNKITRLGAILEALVKGDVALVSDAGTPGLNDPGYELVRDVLAAGYTVSAAPGPSAPLMALVISGLPSDSFLFLGYLPRKQRERRQKLEEAASAVYTLIYLETPHRLLESFEDLLAILGDRQIAVGRELTKLHEEVFRGTISQARDYFQAKEPRGEFTLVISGCQEETRGPWDETRLVESLKEELKTGKPLSQLATELAQKSGWARRDIYRLGGEMKKNGIE